MTQQELQALIGKIYVTHQKNRWEAWRKHQKDVTEAWPLAENERALEVIMSREEAAKWTF